MAELTKTSSKISACTFIIADLDQVCQIYWGAVDQWISGSVALYGFCSYLYTVMWTMNCGREADWLVAYRVTWAVHSMSIVIADYQSFASMPASLPLSLSLPPSLPPSLRATAVGFHSHVSHLGTSIQLSAMIATADSMAEVLWWESEG